MFFIRRVLRRKRRHVLDGVTGYTILATRWEEVRIESAGGKELYAHVHRPTRPGRYPGIIIVPGGFSAGAIMTEIRK